ncbi:MAG: hypothetical protein JSW55_03050 [Chloroflexota bacterium]|nr:MAG: hypothetical protein JSW55_03050 [Chloroflexota bacterium]
MSPARKCTARRKDGRPCQAWARPGGEPALCAAHTRASESKKDRAGFYRPAYTMQEVADLLNVAMDTDLSDELSAARIAVRRVLQQLEQQLSPAEYVRMAELIFRGANTIAGLLRAQLDLSREKSEILLEALSKALDEIGEERDAKL